MSKLFRVVLYLFAIAGAFVLVANTIFSAIPAPAGFAVGAVFTVIYAALFLWAIRFSPMYPRHTSSKFQFWWITSAMVWGSGACLLFSLAVGGPIAGLVYRAHWIDSYLSWAGAYPEEMSKALGVAVILFSFRNLDCPWHGAMTGALIGLGFETSENLGYGSIGALMNPNSDLAGVFSSWGLRLVAGSGLHIVCTALAGWGIGWAVFSTRRSFGRRLLGALGCFLAAFAIHFSWNYTVVDMTVMIIKQVVVALAMYAAVFWLFRTGNAIAAVDASRLASGGLHQQHPADDQDQPQDLHLVQGFAEQRPREHRG